MIKTTYRVVSVICDGDNKEINRRVFKDKRTASRMARVRNQSGIESSMYCVTISSTKFYDVYGIYRNYRLYGSFTKVNILDLNDTKPKLIHIAPSVEDALDYVDNLLK